ncbi:MAG TPA: spore maturation protein [Lacipirellulaceae bacterium]|nr:spore maturation protein [Lacipirellulaceae bacterium]
MNVTDVFGAISQWAIPALIMLIILWAAVKRVPMYESFVTGAKDGFNVAVMIIPYLVAILFAIKIFVASGIFDDLKFALTAVMNYVGLGAYSDSLNLLPLALTKPLTGGGSRGIMLEIFHLYGPDSFLGKTASIMMGSSETTFYILAVYFGAVHVKKVRHTLAACLCADAAGIGTAIIFGYLFYHG